MELAMDTNDNRSLASSAPSSHFASPERSSLREIGEQSRMFFADGLLCTLLGAMPDWVLILNKHRQIVYANDELLSFAKSRGHSGVLGLRLGELLQCQVAATAPSGCGTGEACRSCGAAQAMLEALDGLKATNECRLLSVSQGNVISVDLRVTGTPLECGGEPFILFTASDISPVKRREVLERIFFHDVLNTAGSIRGITDLLSAGDATLPDMIGCLTIASETLVNEIQNQRLLLEAENGDLQLQLQPLSSLGVLGAVSRCFRNHPAGEGREVVISENSQDFTLCSDATILSRIIGNLLKNALEASDLGQKVTLGCERRETGFVFWCQNQKIMPRDIQVQLFQRSFSTKGPGRGVGTYSIKLLTERYLRGKVSFVSSAETGTVFTVTLPESSATGLDPL